MKKNIIISLIFLSVITVNSYAQKKINLLVQLNSQVDGSGNLNFLEVNPTYNSSKNKIIKGIDSLIDFNEINQVIKNQDYRGINILNELNYIGWKLVTTVALSETYTQWKGPRVVFILSKEYIFN